MPRRRYIDREDDLDTGRWMVSYADFVTLLLAFFVVMYSISSVNEGKYRVLSDTMTAAFKQIPKSSQPIQVGKLSKSLALKEAPVNYQKSRSAKEENLDFRTMKDTAQDINKRMSKWVKSGKIKVRGNRNWLEIEINNSILFPVGNAGLSSKAKKLLTELSTSFKDSDNPVYVAGFSDDLPIRTKRYPSNWELSSARAASVVRLFRESGIAPQRMGAIGYGEYRPIAKNTTRQGREQNRRVVIRVFSGTDVFNKASDKAEDLAGKKLAKSGSKPGGKKVAKKAAEAGKKPSGAQILQPVEVQPVGLRPAEPPHGIPAE